MNDENDEIEDIDDIENEFESDDFGDDFDDGSFEGFGQSDNTLADLWNNNPFLKVAVIAVGVIIVAGGVIILSSGGEKVPVSRVASAPEITEAPGTSEVSEEYKNAIEEDNRQRIEQAMRTGESAMPMAVDTVKGTVPLQFEQPEEEDPLERWRRMQEERIRQEQVKKQEEPPPEEPQVDTRTPAINALAEAMAQQMESVLGNQDFAAPQIKLIADLTYLENLTYKEQQLLEQALASQATTNGTGISDDDVVTIIQPAGEIEYAQTLTEANTDVPGPVLAQIASGPLKGGRLIGGFAETERYVTITFTTLVLNGISYPVNAVAIDPGTTLPGLATDIDNRYLKRVILPAAAEFITGLTEAIAESGTTTVTVSGDTTTTTTSNANQDNDQEVATGIAAAGEEIGDILDEMADQTRRLIRVRAGTAIGVLFIQPVTDEPLDITNAQQ